MKKAYQAPKASFIVLDVESEVTVITPSMGVVPNPFAMEDEEE